jgi:hypothetical protein
MARGVAITTIVAAVALLATCMGAGAGERYRGPVEVPWDYEVRNLGNPPFLLTPNFLPWVPGCYQTRVIRTPYGWVRQLIWVCS